jgi:hypothetical protein
LCRTLLCGHRLGVRVQRDTDCRMPHQFLHDLEFGTSSPEQRGIRPTKSMPPDGLDDTYPLGGGTNMMTKKLLSPIWALSSLLRTWRTPNSRRCVGALSIQP